MDICCEQKMMMIFNSKMLDLACAVVQHAGIYQICTAVV